MHGASISRWTMAYFAAAIAFLLAGTASMAFGFGLVTTSTGAPGTLAVVHMITVGWLGLLFCGALLQIVPVLAATQLKLPWLAVPALLSLILGLLALITGLLALGGHVEIDPRIASLGGVLLGLGFGLVALSVAVTILSKRAFGISGVLVLVGIVSLVLTVASGNGFAGLLSGVLTNDNLSSQLTALVPLHAASGLLGWMTLTALGVSYRLFAMFMLAPEDRNSSKTVVFLAVSAIVLLLTGFVVSTLGMNGQQVILFAAFCLAALLAVLYLRDVWRMFVTRRRKALELNSLAGLIALGFLFAGFLMLAVAQSASTDLPAGPAAFYLLGMGWLSGLGLAQLYKIVPFLTWLETYGPVMGRSAVPRVQDLVNEGKAIRWFAIFFASVGVGTCAILAGSDLLMQLAAGCQFVSVLALAIEFLRARTLAYVPDPLQLPSGALRPHLIFATIKE